MAGLIALLSYVKGVSEGPAAPYGKPDITFEQPESLLGVLCGALECLQAVAQPATL